MKYSSVVTKGFDDRYSIISESYMVTKKKLTVQIKLGNWWAKYVERRNKDYIA